MGFGENLKKGRMAESIVEELFRLNGWRVEKYGYEYTVPHLCEGANLKGDAGHFIRHQPDFVVVNKKNEAFFVEVKFRTEEIRPDEIFPYPECYIVVVTPDFIYAQNLEDLQVKRSPFVYINQLDPFKSLDINIIYKMLDKTRRKLGKETLVSQIAKKVIKKMTKANLVEYRKQIKVKFRPKKLITEFGNTYQEIQDPPEWFVKKYHDRRKQMVRNVTYGKVYVKGKHYKYLAVITKNHTTFYKSKI